MLINSQENSLHYVLHRTDKKVDRHDPDLLQWFDGKFPGSEEKAIAGIERWIAQEYGDLVGIQKNPIITGLRLLDISLPPGCNYMTLPAGIGELIHSVSSQHRRQTFDHGHGYEYDARSAYIALCRNVPVFLGDHVQRDQLNVFEGYRQGWYLVDVTVPRGWKHIGIIPGVCDGKKYRSYPDRPGTSWQVWLHGCEVRLLIENHWPHKILQRLLFHPETGKLTTDPLRTWIAPIRYLLEHIERHKEWSEDHIKAIRYGVRAMGLRTIGMFHHRGGQDTIDVDRQTGMPTVKVSKELTPFTGRYHHPEWSAAIWAKCRVRTTRIALALPRNDIMAIHSDAIILRDCCEKLPDDGRVGTTRFKGEKDI